MDEKGRKTILFLISLLIGALLVFLAWNYLWEMLAFLGVALFVFLMLVLIIGIAVAIMQIVMIPFFAITHPSEVQEGDYSIDSAKEPGKDEKD